MTLLAEFRGEFVSPGAHLVESLAVRLPQILYSCRLLDWLVAFLDAHSIGCRNADCGRRVRRHGNLQRQFSAFEFPRSRDPAPDRIVSSFGPGQAVANDRLNKNVLESRVRRANAANAAEQILAARAKGIMVKGVHAGILKSLLRRPTIPAFPDGGGAVFHREQPGRKGILQKQAVGGISLARLS